MREPFKFALQDFQSVKDTDSSFYSQKSLYSPPTNSVKCFEFLFVWLEACKITLNIKWNQDTLQEGVMPALIFSYFLSREHNEPHWSNAIIGFLSYLIFKFFSNFYQLFIIPDCVKIEQPVGSEYLLSYYSLKWLEVQEQSQWCYSETQELKRRNGLPRWRHQHGVMICFCMEWNPFTSIYFYTLCSFKMQINSQLKSSFNWKAAGKWWSCA